MITKIAKKSICGIMAAIILLCSSHISARAAATYSAYEIISMIFAVVGGITLEQSQGLLGSSAFDENALYESMNNQKTGIGTTLASYVNRAQYLGPGSDLIISEDDYLDFLEFFRDYNMQNSLSGEITNSNKSEFLEKISQFSGIEISSIPNDLQTKINNGTYKYAFAFTTPNNEKRIAFGGDYSFMNVASDGSTKSVIFTANYTIYESAWNTYSKSYWGAMTYREGTLSVQSLMSGTGYKADALTNGKIKNGTYDTVSKSRAWDATQGKITGRATITMPATQTLDEVLQRENVKDITDAVNVYPVDTADDTMIYYPTQSATDFIVPEMTVQTNVNVQFPAIEGEAGAYTMDLTNFFPFCIPFDIYAFLQAFETEPEAPSITYNFPYLDNNGNVAYVQQTYSLSQFDGVAQLVRSLELIAFIVGLAFVTRSYFLRG